MALIEGCVAEASSVYGLTILPHAFVGVSRRLL